MPELPEVQTVVNELNDSLIGKHFSQIEICDFRGVNFNPEHIINQPIVTIYRRGKYIVFRFSNECYFIVHLRMTGKFVFGSESNDVSHVKVCFTLSDGELLYFCDVRTFGTLEYAEDIQTFFASMGAEPLTDEFNSTYLFKMLQNSKRPIKNSLLDQSVVAGVGNIYADESLYLSNIGPTRPSNTLSKQEIETLVSSIKNVLNQSLENMGTTLSDYRTTKNIGGENQHYLNVYGQSGRACLKCNSIIEKIKLAGRGTHYCPTCQK